MMHLLKRILAYSALLFLVVSCSSLNRPVDKYGPGNLGTESRLMITPVNRETPQTSHYLSGRYSFNNGRGFNQNETESCRYGEAFYNLGHSRKYLSTALGAGVFGGSYEVEKYAIAAGWKSFYGIGGMAQAALNLPLGPVNWRIIGLRGGFALENGPLYDFRKKNRNVPGFNEFTSGRTTGYFAPYSELCIHARDFRFGLSGNNTFLLGKEKILDFISSYSFFLEYQDLSLVYQLTGSVKQGQNHSIGLVIKLPCRANQPGE